MIHNQGIPLISNAGIFMFYYIVNDTNPYVMFVIKIYKRFVLLYESSLQFCIPGADPIEI
jgi:hypothetical protein